MTADTKRICRTEALWRKLTEECFVPQNDARRAEAGPKVV